MNSLLQIVRIIYGVWQDHIKVVLIVKALYGLKSSRAYFRAVFSEKFHDLSYRP